MVRHRSDYRGQSNGAAKSDAGMQRLGSGEIGVTLFEEGGDPFPMVIRVEALIENPSMVLKMVLPGSLKPPIHEFTKPRDGKR